MMYCIGIYDAMSVCLDTTSGHLAAEEQQFTFDLFVPKMKDIFFFSSFYSRCCPASLTLVVEARVVCLADVCIEKKIASL